jgi:polysaccharide biosynthesis/export protein
MRNKMILIACALSVMLSPAHGQDKGTQTWSAKTSGGDYTIGAADILEIITWKEIDFSKSDILVRMDGKISFPLLNDVQAAGLTTAELKRIIEQGLKNYVSHPVVTVAVKNPASQKYYVLGEVVRTGEYPLIKNMTVLQAFAVAGGFTQWASKDEIILVRRDSGKDNVYRVNYKDIAKGRDFSQNLIIRPDDTIIVP